MKDYLFGILYLIIPGFIKLPPVTAQREDVSAVIGDDSYWSYCRTARLIAISIGFSVFGLIKNPSILSIALLLLGIILMGSLKQNLLIDILKKTALQTKKGDRGVDLVCPVIALADRDKTIATVNRDSSKKTPNFEVLIGKSLERYQEQKTNEQKVNLTRFEKDLALMNELESRLEPLEKYGIRITHHGIGNPNKKKGSPSIFLTSKHALAPDYEIYLDDESSYRHGLTSVPQFYDLSESLDQLESRLADVLVRTEFLKHI